MHIFFLILGIISASFADVSHLANNLQADGYHYEQPSFPFPSVNEIVPQQPLSARNDFNPPAFLLGKPEEPAPQPVPEYIPPAPTPAETNLQEDGYHYEQPSIPFQPQQTLSARNDFNPPAFLLAKPEEPEQPAPQPITEPPTIPTPQYIPPPPSTIATNLQEDGYHYQQPSIPFPSVNEIIPQQTLSARNDFNPPAFLLAKPDEPEPQEPITERPAVQITEVISTQPSPVISNLQEDGYHYEQPSIPFVPQQTLSARNDFNPPAFLLAKPDEPEPQEPITERPAVQITEVISTQPSPVISNLQEDGYHYEQPSIPFIPKETLSARNDFNPPAFLIVKPEEPAPTPEEPILTPEEPVPTPEEPAPTPEEPEPVEPVPQEPLPVAPVPVEPVTERPTPQPVPIYFKPAPTYTPAPEYIPPVPVQTNLQEDGYHYEQPSIPFIQSEPYNPIREHQPVKQQISTYFDSTGPEPEPSYSLGPNGYNYRVPSRPFRF